MKTLDYCAIFGEPERLSEGGCDDYEAQYLAGYLRAAAMISTIRPAAWPSP